jgi:hypothetical protein
MPLLKIMHQMIKFLQKMDICAYDYQYEKIGVRNYAYNWILVATTTCNSLYFYSLSAIKQVVKVVIHNFPYMKLYTYAIHATMLQLYHCNYCATMLQLPCYYIVIIVSPCSSYHVIT